MSTSLLHQELSTEKGQSCPPIPDSNPLNPKSPALRTTSNSTILNSPIETINVNTSSKSNISGESTINGSAYSNSTTVVQLRCSAKQHHDNFNPQFPQVPEQRGTEFRIATYTNTNKRVGTMVKVILL